MAYVTLHPVARAAEPMVQAWPAHEHDCPCCKFVAATQLDGRPGPDLWHCASDGATPEGTLIIRHSDEDQDCSSFPVFVARAVGAVESMPDVGLGWQRAVELYDEWTQAGKPERQILLEGANFLTHFTVVMRGDAERPDHGEHGKVFRLVTLSPLVRREHVDYYVRTEFPATHCQHEYDCCAQAYSGQATWSYVENTAERAVLVTQSWHLNI